MLVFYPRRRQAVTPSKQSPKPHSVRNHSVSISQLSNALTVLAQGNDNGNGNGTVSFRFQGGIE